MLELTDTNNIAYLFLSAANRWLEVRTVCSLCSRHLVELAFGLESVPASIVWTFWFVYVPNEI